MNKIRLEGPTNPIRGTIHISGSKSISNRILLIRALGGIDFDITNLSNSDDTQTLNRLINSELEEYDAHHAGTTFRFLTAYFSMKAGSQILTGSDRMKQRPIGPLVDALRELGADITYLENEGYPPLRIGSFNGQKNKTIKIKADISSQFISALCMIAPVLEEGLEVVMEGDLVSKPYLEMTLGIMRDMGVESSFEGNSISVTPQKYTPHDYVVESDWSSASYFFSIAAIAKDAEINLSHFFKESLQGDSAVADIVKGLGVESTFDKYSLNLKSSDQELTDFNYDFIKQPDLTQTFAVICGAKNIHASYKGLKTLAIKETDRVAALKNELAKVGITISQDHTEEWEYIQSGVLKISDPEFDTYQDHRMAMALAPLALVAPVVICDPMVVTKSYPDYWKDLESLGFKITPIQ